MCYMKRFFTVFLTLVSIISMACVRSYAEENGASISEKTIMDVLIDAAEEQNLQEKFFNDEMLPEEYLDYSIKGKPVLMTICYHEHEWKANDVVETFTKMWEDQAFGILEFTVVETSPNEEGIQTVSYIAKTKYNDDHERVGKLRFDKSPHLPGYMERLLLEPAVQLFLGEEHTISNVIIVGAHTMPKKVYFTDGK